MQNAIILHGMPSEEGYFNNDGESQSSGHWLPWLRRQLQLKDIDTETPEWPESYKPVYEKYCNLFESFLVGGSTILVGHSLGGGFLIRWLSENKDKKVGKVILVAPWLDPDRREDFPTGDFFNFKIDKNIVKRTGGVTVLISDDDELDQQKSVEIIKKEVPGSKIIQFHGYGHFTQGGMHGRTDFPELLDECLKQE